MLFVLVFATVSQSQERLGFWGVGYGLVGDRTSDQYHHAGMYGFNSGFFLSSNWVLLANWSLNLGPIQRRQFVTGFRLYLSKEKMLMPLVELGAAFQNTPKKNLGYSAMIGLEYNLRPLTMMDNYRIVFRSGLTQLILQDEKDDYIFNYLQASLDWNF